VYRQAKVFQRDGKLYAQYGGGFVGLRRDGGTTVPTIQCDWIEGVDVAYNELGAMLVLTDKLKHAAARAA
jgi:hypothetical protein